MSVTICWKPTNVDDRHFETGTSSDLEIFDNIFGREVSTKDTDKLRAMAAACNHKPNLWGEIADTLDRMSDDGARDITISVWGRW